MKGMDGMETAKRLRAGKFRGFLIFITVLPAGSFCGTGKNGCPASSPGSRSAHNSPPPRRRPGSGKSSGVFQSFEVQAYDYLVKPIEEARFEKTMERLLASMCSGPYTPSRSYSPLNAPD